MKLNKVNINGAFNFNRWSWAMWALGSKRKPKSHLGILKEEKDQMRSHSFQERLRDWERAWEGEVSIFSEEERAAKKWHEFQGKAGHGFRGKSAARRIRTVRIWYGQNLLHLFYPYNSTQIEGTSAFNALHKSYGRRTAATIYGHDFLDKSYSI